MAYGIPPKSELDEAVYLAWLDKHPPVFGAGDSHSASKLQCDFDSTLGIGRAYEILELWQDINWLPNTQFCKHGYVEGSPSSIESAEGDKAWQEKDPEGHADYWLGRTQSLRIEGEA
jgi:hypothetical protein